MMFGKRSISKRDTTQFLRYYVATWSYFWSGYLIFAVCYSGLHWQWWPAKMAGDVVGWTLNYLLQRYWAFANQSFKKREGAALVKYIIITACNFALDYAIVGGLKHIGISPYVGFIISAGFFAVWNFVWYRFWVFLGKTKEGTA